MSSISKEMREKAMIFYGHDDCKAAVQRVLSELVHLPITILPIVDGVECGYVPETGFTWIKQKKKRECKCPRTGKLNIYSNEITAYAQNCKLYKITGIKAKEMMMWFPLLEVNVTHPGAEMINFFTIGGISRSYPAKLWMDDTEVKSLKQEEHGSHGAVVMVGNHGGSLLKA